MHSHRPSQSCVAATELTCSMLAAEWATVLFVVFVSLGEAIWSPRWYDYSMSVAPEVRLNFPLQMVASCPCSVASRHERLVCPVGNVADNYVAHGYALYVCVSPPI